MYYEMVQWYKLLLIIYNYIYLHQAFIYAEVFSFRSKQYQRKCLHNTSFPLPSTSDRGQHFCSVEFCISLCNINSIMTATIRNGGSVTNQVIACIYSPLIFKTSISKTSLAFGGIV